MIAIEELRINPNMIVLARESRGFSQKDLADRIGISPTLLCKIEQESRTISNEITNRLCQVLKYPIDLFYFEGDAYIPTNLIYRKKEHVSQKLLLPLEAQINLYRLNVEILDEKIVLPDVNLPVINNRADNEIEEVAKEIRNYWKIPRGPIESITEVMEQNGIIIISFDFRTERVDSRTIFTKKKQPLVVINKTLLGDRERFSLAHELGHLVLHMAAVPKFDRDVTHEANLFAAALLMPKSEMRKEFEMGVSIPLLGDLKRKWKVSMQALLYRANDLGYITDNQKHYLLKQFNQLRIRRREPPELDIPKEKPVLLRDLITKYKTAQKATVKKIAEMLLLSEEEFLIKYSNN